MSKTLRGLLVLGIIAVAVILSWQVTKETTIRPGDPIDVHVRVRTEGGSPAVGVGVTAAYADSSASEGGVPFLVDRQTNADGDLHFPVPFQPGRLYVFAPSKEDWAFVPESLRLRLRGVVRRNDARFLADFLAVVTQVDQAVTPEATPGQTVDTEPAQEPASASSAYTHARPAERDVVEHAPETARARTEPLGPGVPALPPGKTSVEASSVEAPRVAAPPVAAPPVEAPRVEAPPVAAPPVEAPPVEAPRVAAPRVEAPPVEAPPVEAPRVAAPPVAAPRVAAPPVEAPRVAAPPVEAPPVEAPPVEAPPVGAPRVEAQPFTPHGSEPAQTPARVTESAEEPPSVEPAQASTAPATPEVKEEPPALTVTLPPETPPVAPAVESLASSASPRDPRLVQAEQLFRAGDYERVLAIENRPPQSGSPDFLQQQETYLQLEEFRGCAHMARGSMDSAAEIFRRILQQSRRGLAQYNLLVCCHHLGLYQEVVEHAYPDLIRAKSTLPSARLKEVLLKAEFFHAFAHYKLCQEAEMQTRAPACRRAKDELEDYVRRWASEQSLPEAQTYVGSAQYHLDDLISHSQ